MSELWGWIHKIESGGYGPTRANNIFMLSFNQILIEYLLNLSKILYKVKINLTYN